MKKPFINSLQIGLFGTNLWFALYESSGSCIVPSLPLVSKLMSFGLPLNARQAEQEQKLSGFIFFHLSVST